MSTYFIADMHIGHEKIIQYDKRPFSDKRRMFFALKDKWNRTVSPDDTVYILGDFLWTGDPTEAIITIRQLNGHLVWILGNHDRVARFPEVRELFEEVTSYKEIEVDGKHIVLSHFPIASWKNMQGTDNKRSDAWIHIHGHVHMKEEYLPYLRYLSSLSKPGQAPLKSYNAGAMCPWINYTPRTLEEIQNSFDRHWRNVLLNK